MGDPSLHALKSSELLYERLFDRTRCRTKPTRSTAPESYFSLLLLSLIVITWSVDTSICERGFAQP